MLHSNLMPRLRSLSNLDVDHRIRQAEVGDAVLQHAAGFLECLVDGDVAAGLRHVGRARHSGRAGADDADLEAVALDVRQVRPALRNGHVTDEALQPADRHRLQRVADGAHAFALGLLRTDASAHRRQQVGVGDRVVRAVEILCGELHDEAGDVDPHRAAAHAGLVGAVEAPLASISASPVSYPRATSSKLRTRTSGACSGIGVRACGIVRIVFFLATVRARFQSLNSPQRGCGSSPATRRARPSPSACSGPGAPSGRRNRPGVRRSRARRRRRT